MNGHYEEDDYYEPTVADEIFNRYKQELEESLKQEIKNEIKATSDHNARLLIENQSLKQQVRNLDNRERDLANREAQFERSMLRKKFSELLQPLEEQMEVYSADHEWKYGEKCDKCDSKRKIYYKSPSGRDMYEDCSCNKSYKIYKPKLKMVTSIHIGKDRDRTKFYYSPKYGSKNYDEDFCKFEVEVFIENLDKVNDIGDIDAWRTEYKTGFKKKEDCQKYCDYLNKKNKVPKYVLDKIGK